MLESLLGRLAAGDDLTQEEMEQAIDSIFTGDVSEGEIGLLLTGLRIKGESVAEIAGAAASLRKRMTRIHTRRSGLVDTCGTGGDGTSTFNISTAAAIVVAAAGTPVAKHGNRKVTGRTGSADVLSALGVNVDAPLSAVEACLNELGLCFCFAPLWHPAMKQVAAVRRSLGTPTIFNILGPLANPAGAPYQLIGAGTSEVRTRLAAALALLGTTRAAVVHGEDGLDEVTLGGPTHATVVEEGVLREVVWRPDDFGLPIRHSAALAVADAHESAAVIRDVLAGQSGAARDVVLANAAAALWVAGQDETLDAAVRRSAAAIDDGRAREKLVRLAELTGRGARGEG